MSSFCNQMGVMEPYPFKDEYCKMHDTRTQQVDQTVIVPKKSELSLEPIPLDKYSFQYIDLQDEGYDDIFELLTTCFSSTELDNIDIVEHEISLQGIDLCKQPCNKSAKKTKRSPRKKKQWHE